MIKWQRILMVRGGGFTVKFKAEALGVALLSSFGNKMDFDQKFAFAIFIANRGVEIERARE